jgi:ankyrin repeat protein
LAAQVVVAKALSASRVLKRASLLSIRDVPGLLYEEVLQKRIELNPDGWEKNLQASILFYSALYTASSSQLRHPQLEKHPQLEREGTGPAFLWAATKGHEAVVRLLVEKGADIKVKTTNVGLTASHMAAVKGHVAVLRLLVEKEADIKANT